MSKFIEELRKLPRFTSPKGMLFPANDGELVEVGSVITLFRKFEADQKTITELAVKEIDALREGLTSIINMDNPIKSACIDRMHMIAKHTRTIADKIQIERLSHE